MEYERLGEENEQLQRAVTSHAIVDQAIGALVVLGRIPPEEAWRALRDVSQRTNTKLRVVAEDVLKFAQGGTLPNVELDELPPVTFSVRVKEESAGGNETGQTYQERMRAPMSRRQRGQLAQAPWCGSGAGEPPRRGDRAATGQGCPAGACGVFPRRHRPGDRRRCRRWTSDAG
ncbi:ANTAR domain-containing protein [Streptomyces sp. NPDC047009]